MFAAAELGQKIDRETLEKELPGLRVGLVNAQYDVCRADFAVVIAIEGDDRIGCNAILRGMHEWMDGRLLGTHALDRPTDEERERPEFWRYWRRLPRRGQMGVFLDAWTLAAVSDRLEGRIAEGGLARRIEHIRRFEQALVDDGTLLLKFWLHLPRREHKRRLKRADKKPDRAWRVREQDRAIAARYDEVLPVAERVLRETSTGDAPWHVIESSDARYRTLAVAKTVLATLTRRLAGPVGGGAADPEPHPEVPRERSVLDTVDLSRSYSREEYAPRLERHQSRLNRLSHRAADQGLASVLVVEGWDAAGKGGIIRRITSAMDPRLYRVISVAAPTEEEAAHHYLWRFWRNLPRAGRMTIFDRSWYGRVLVERVEGLADERAWRRSYAEIRDFERQLCDHGIVLCKCWVHIDPDEQLRRFEARAQTAYKKHKLSPEDYRNRARWSAYEAAVDEMVARTHTGYAPWRLVPGNDKRFARVTVMRALCHGLERTLVRD